MKRLTLKEKKLPGISYIIMLISVIGVSAFLIRLVQPIGTSILNMQLCNFAEYIVLFIVGILVYRYKWLDKLTYKTGRKFLKLTYIAGLLVWFTILIAGGGLTDGFDAFMGGLYWQSFAYSIWEAFIVITISIGLLGVFKEKYNKEYKFAKRLSDNAFAVYVFHAPIIIAITYNLRYLDILPIFKYVLMIIVCIPICFFVSHFIIRKIPLLKKVL
jgi:hypothetical protein